ncbi:beta-lactamase domain-containing protein 2-like [Asterias rubens]|uniref:beta-lactamase domain-containing protein 2-like n=1 Tax=Asterias rubens TaxID=7604 RepID=UPI001454E711|nr:beta-lactamase domain-containing protein 2-like [Asterias rubens]
MAFMKNALLVCITAVLVVYVPSLWTKTPPTLTAGTVQPGFEPVLKVFRENFAKGVESPTGGSAFSVYYKGAKVIDLWGGYADTEALRPWREDTMAIVYSSTKGMAATCIALLADRGHIDYDKTVASYWPEFALNGKENITVRMLLNHEGGLSYTDGPISFEQLADQDVLGQLLAKEAPKWEPGSAHGYHGMTFGLYVSQLLRRADPKHRTLGQFFKEEIAQTFDVDFHIGLPLEVYHRVARPPAVTALWQTLFKGLTSPLNRQVMWAMATGKTDFLKVLNIESMTQAEHFLNPEVLALEQPSASGIGTARAIAKVYGMMANGGTTRDGRKFLSDGLIKKFIGEAEKVATMDRTIGLKMLFNLGFMITDEGEQQFGHPGSGGAQGRADPKWRIGMAYITSYPTPFSMGDDERFLTLEKATYECVKKLEAK